MRFGCDVVVYGVWVACFGAEDLAGRRGDYGQCKYNGAYQRQY